MIVWSIWDIVGIAFWVLVFLAFIFVCIMAAIKNKLHNIFGKKKANKEKEKEDTNKINIEMCRKAVQSGVCPHTCDICAWNTLTGK